MLPKWAAGKARAARIAKLPQPDTDKLEQITYEVWQNIRPSDVFVANISMPMRPGNPDADSFWRSVTVLQC